MIQAHQGKKVNLRQVCHNFALEQVQLQKEQLKKLGLFTNYEEYYITLDKKYEAELIRIFGEMVKKGLIYQGFRPIHWSCGHETALAGAEIEYYEKKDTSLYFKIKLAGIKKTATYVLVECEGEYLLMLEKQLNLLEKWEKPSKVEKKLLGKELVGKHYFHPYRKNNKGYIVSGDEFIQEEEGTGIVHLAPAFGAEDFMVAKKEKLIIECPMEPNGIFNQKIGVSELVGKHYSEVNVYVVADLEKRNLVVRKKWFIKVEAIKKELLENIKKVECILPLLREKFPDLVNKEAILGTDIMDVWLDSGVSHWCALRKNQGEYNTKEKRGKAKELDISGKNLKGDLDLSEFINLEDLDCSYNQLGTINLSNCLKLRVLDCSFNKLTDLELTNLSELEIINCNENYLNKFNYSSLNPEKLVILNLSDNNLPEKDLSVFGRLSKLKGLYIGGNNKNHFAQNIYNKFFGSLRPLRNLAQLKDLLIDNTDINGGIEYLPEKLRHISYSTERRSESKVKEIEEQLR
ncbi:14110_t:CDS:2 [Funneliformis geosporum]|nr:14110_t:CDS:2 [Funneliformis geosporum]